MGRLFARLATLLMLSVHLWLTLQIFGPVEDSKLLTSDPVLAGRHALHAWHGQLGAQAWKHHRAVTVYDPTFHAGYPKTPWFDADSKPAELFFLFGSPGTDSVPYKLGLAFSWLLLPAAAYGAAGLLGLSHGIRCLSLGLQMTLVWSALGLDCLWAGDLAWMLGSAALTVALAMTTRLFTQPTIRFWLAGTACYWGVIFLQPLLLLLLVPALLAYYLRVGWQRSWSWQVSFGVMLLVALGGNFPWLAALLREWWILADQPVGEGSGLATARASWLEVWANDPSGSWLWAALTLGLGTWGLHRLRRCLPTGSTRGWLVVWVFALALAAGGHLLDGWLRFEPHRGLYLAVTLAVVPAAVALRHGVAWLAERRIKEITSWSLVSLGLAGLAMVTGGILITIVFSLPFDLIATSAWPLAWPRLPIGLPQEVQDLIAELRTHTTPAARILWEEEASAEAWSPLLPALTERHFIGGLSRRRVLEHQYLTLSDGQLAGKALFSWSNAELERIANLLNIGWVVAYSPATLARCANWPLAEPPQPLAAGRKLIKLRRNPSYVLQGQARVVRFTANQLTLVDLEPDQGVILLSLHAHPLIRTTTSRVIWQQAAQVDDPVPLVRLLLTGPMSRLTICWD
jgi:hypothetical protein